MPSSRVETRIEKQITSISATQAHGVGLADHQAGREEPQPGDQHGDGPGQAAALVVEHDEPVGEPEAVDGDRAEVELPRSKRLCHHTAAGPSLGLWT